MDLIFSDVRNLNNRNHVVESRDQIHHVLAEYNQNCYSNIPVSNNGNRFLNKPVYNLYESACLILKDSFVFLHKAL